MSADYVVAAYSGMRPGGNAATSIGPDRRPGPDIARLVLWPLVQFGADRHAPEPPLRTQPAPSRVESGEIESRSGLDGQWPIRMGNSHRRILLRRTGRSPSLH